MACTASLDCEHTDGAGRACDSCLTAVDHDDSVFWLDQTARLRVLHCLENDGLCVLHGLDELSVHVLQISVHLTGDGRVCGDAEDVRLREILGDQTSRSAGLRQHDDELSVEISRSLHSRRSDGLSGGDDVAVLEHLVANEVVLDVIVDDALCLHADVPHHLHRIEGIVAVSTLA